MLASGSFEPLVVVLSDGDVSADDDSARCFVLLDGLSLSSSLSSLLARFLGEVAA